MHEHSFAQNVYFAATFVPVCGLQGELDFRA